MDSVVAPAELDFLKRKVLHHLALMKQLPEMLKSLSADSRTTSDYQLLQLAIQYHKAEQDQGPDWTNLHNKFADLLHGGNKTDDVTVYFLRRYLFLTSWKVDQLMGGTNISTEAHLEEARNKLQAFREPLTFMLHGDLAYQLSIRWLQIGHRDTADTCLRTAASLSCKWYKHVRRAQEEFAIVAHAGRQVQNIHAAFLEHTFKESISESGISDDLLQDICEYLEVGA